MHGYEMIKEIEERTEGAWSPSAGSNYPTLQLLEDEGLISGEEIEGKRRFSLTEAGAAEQAEKAGETTPWDAVRADAAPEQIQLARLDEEAPPRDPPRPSPRRTRGPAATGPRAARRDPAQDLRDPRRGGLSAQRASAGPGPRLG